MLYHVYVAARLTFCILAHAGCPEGWDEFGSLCYFHVNKDKMTMDQGQDECQLLGATLPVIKSAEENDFLLNLMARNSGHLSPHSICGLSTKIKMAENTSRRRPRGFLIIQS